MNYFRFVLVFFCLHGVISLHAQIPLDSIIPKELLENDLLMLKEAVLQTHQNPYTYCSQDDIDQAFDDAIRKVRSGQSYFDFATTCGDFLKVFKDSHTSVNFSALYGYIRKLDKHVLNIKIRSLDGKVYLLNDKDGELHSGVELVEINGYQVSEIWKKVSLLSVYEGDSEAGFARITDALFPYLINIAVEIKKENTLLYRNPSTNEKVEVNMTGFTFKELKKKAKDNKYKPYEFYVDHEYSIAYIKIKTFSHDKRPKYYKFLRQSYNRVLSSGIENLVLDLRGNTGGLINRSEMLLTMFADTTIHLPKNMIAKQSAVSLDYYNRKYKGLNRWFINHWYQDNEKVSSYRRIMNMEIGEVDTLRFSEGRTDYFPEFKGDSYLLINGSSGSASVLFTAAFVQNELGVVLGEPCLGPLSGTWGNPTNFKLNNSGLNILLSVLRTNSDDQFFIDPVPISPDVLINYTEMDLYNEVDLEMEYIKELIKNKD